MTRFQFLRGSVKLPSEVTIHNIESLKLEKTLRSSSLTISSMPTDHISATSPWFWSTSKDSDSSTSLGSLFQCITTLFKSNFFLIL